MKAIKNVIVMAVMVAILSSVASAGNVNPLVIAMEKDKVVGPGPGESDPKSGVLRGIVDSPQMFSFQTNSPWHVGVSDGMIAKDGIPIDSFFDVFYELDTGMETGAIRVAHTNREILEILARKRMETLEDKGIVWSPISWNPQSRYMVIITYQLYSDDKIGNTYLTDTITFIWDIGLGNWRQVHEVRIWSDGASEIPEFPTVALPIIAVIGLMFLFQRRKNS